MSKIKSKKTSVRKYGKSVKANSQELARYRKHELARYRKHRKSVGASIRKLTEPFKAHFQVPGVSTRKTANPALVTHISPTPVAGYRVLGAGLSVNERMLSSPALQSNLSADQVVAIFVKAQGRFLASFNLYYGQALERAFNHMNCPVQPGMVNRLELMQFADWANNRATRVRLEAVIAHEMKLILRQLEREVISDFIRKGGV